MYIVKIGMNIVFVDNGKLGFYLYKRQKKVDLQNHNLDCVPLELLLYCKQLSTLILKRNMIEEIPKAMTSSNVFASIKIMDLGNNNIKEFDSLMCLTNLRCLCLENNDIGDIPENINELKRLKILDLSHNKIKRIPASIGELKRLQSLYLSDNMIEELPHTLNDCSNLLLLYINSNMIRDASVLKLDKLEYLSLCDNTPMTERPNLCYFPNILYFDTR